MDDSLGSSSMNHANNSLDGLVDSLNMPLTTQQILLQGNDNVNSFSVYGQDVNVIASHVSCSNQTSLGSNKVQIQPVANFEWVSKFYIGKMVAVHRNGIHLAYVLKGKGGGMIRIVNNKTAHRGLIKGFMGRVLDVAFSHSDLIILAAIDEVGNFQVHEIRTKLDAGEDTKIDIICLLTIERPTHTPLSEFHRVIWCPFIPDGEDDSTDDDNDASKLLMVSHDEKAEAWHIDVVIREYGNGPLEPSDVQTGFIEICGHEDAIIDAAFSPEGTFLATASLDGNVKFFQIYMLQEKSEQPRCLHVWKPHNGHPVSSIFFLDDHKHKNPETEFWKFCITAGDNNREIKVWNCQSWNCLQTIRFQIPLIDAPTITEPCLQTSIDLSVNYLVMSDIKRKVLYVLQLYQQADNNMAHISSVSEFLLTQPLLSLCVLDAATKKIKTEQSNQSADEDCLSDDEDVETNNVSVGVSVKLYAVTTRALQELTVRFQPRSSTPQIIPGSIGSVSQDDIGLQDGLTDVSMDTTIASEDINGSFHSDSSKAKDYVNAKPLLMTPAAFTFTSSPKRHDEVISPENLTQRSTGSSFTQVSALNDESITPRSSLDQSIRSPINNSIPLEKFPLSPKVKTPNSTKTLTPDSSHTLTPTSLPLPPVTPGEFSYSPKGSPIGSSPQFTDSSISSLMKTDDLVTINKQFADANSSFNNLGGAYNESRSPYDKTRSIDAGVSETVNAMFETSDTHHTTSKSTSASSSSSTSLEVSEIMSADVKPEQEVDGAIIEDEDDLDNNEDEVIEEEEVTTPVLADGQLIGQYDTAPPSGPYDATIWPKAPNIVPVSQTVEATDHREDLYDTEAEANAAGITVNPALIAGSIENHSQPILQINNTLQDILAVLQVQQQEIYQLKTELQQGVMATQQNINQSQDRKLEENILDGLNAALHHNQEEENKKLQKMLKAQESRDKQREEKLTASVCGVLSQKVDKTIRAEVKHILVPCVTKILDPLKEQLHTEMAAKLTATDSLMKENISKLVRSRQTVESIGQAAGQAVLGTVQSTYREAFQEIVVPTFERACQNMMQQLNDTFHSGTKEYIKHLENQLERVQRKQQEQRDGAIPKLQNSADKFSQTVDNLQKSMNQMFEEQLQNQLRLAVSRLQEVITTDIQRMVKHEISSAMKNQHTAVTQNLIAAMRANASTPVPLPPDPQQQKTQIMLLLTNGQLNSAFQQALSAADLDLVMFVCETVDPGQVFDQTPCPLQQPVILSLIQQLSADLNDNTELRHRYLEEAVMNLDMSNPITHENSHRVLTGLLTSLNVYIRSNPADKMNRSMKMLLMATQSLIK